LSTSPPFIWPRWTYHFGLDLATPGSGFNISETVLMAASTEGESSSAAAKSKQERIRDNQRKSRARRQEYLADLEHRLRESHALCREADLQKTAFTELQTENSSLRRLLTLAGVQPDVIDTFLRQNGATDQQGSETSSSLRQLKPKLPTPSPQPSPPSQCPSNDSRCASAQSFTRNQTQAYDSNPVASNGQISYSEPDIYAPRTTSMDQLIHTSAASLQGEINWFFEPSAAQPQPTAENPPPFCCDSFLIPTNGPLLEGDRDAVLCSVARDLIYQFNIPPREMDAIRLKLATGFSRPSAPGGGCRVNNQLLFQVLNEISAKYG
jgi:hypothetical protein